MSNKVGAVIYFLILLCILYSCDGVVSAGNALMCTYCRCVSCRENSIHTQSTRYFFCTFTILLYNIIK